MNCSNCQTANPEGAKFCMNCGHPLAIKCPNCGVELPAQAKFCFNCGHQLGQASAPAAKPAAPEPQLHRYMTPELRTKLDAASGRSGAQGERRVVTMLFCDVKGSTALAETLDPEEWTSIMNQAFERMITPVYKYEGTIARLMGDAILAFFGAPIAHEDDPQRAVLAGLEIVQGIRAFREQIRDRYGLELDVRVGINTGLVVVGEVGADLRVEYTAMGDAVNLAARMEQTAAPGSVQIAADTYKRVAPLFDVQPLGAIEVKGKTEPVEAYRVLRPRAQPGPLRGIVGLDSPLVGREREMDMLKAQLDHLRQGQGGIVSVIGEAGLGKSRLVAEARRTLKTLPDLTAEDSPAETVQWHEGRCLSYQTSTPYAPFSDWLSRYFAFQPEDADAEKYAKIKTQLGALSPERAAELAPFIAALFEIPVTGTEGERIRYLQPPQLREGVFQAVGILIELLAGEQPLVLVFEDLHWADSVSLDLIERLLALTGRVSLLVIALFRPLREEPSWRFHEIASREYPHRYVSIALEPLDESHSRELVANLLHIEDLPEKVRGLVLKKSEGNPFFVEEVIRSLLDARLVVRDNGHWRATREIENISVPDTLVGVITARLDRLDEPTKRTVQTASVIGREFEYALLTEVYDTQQALDPSLESLQQRELIREKSRLPARTFIFKHALTQETAYASLLLSKRRDLHRRVAERLENRRPELVNDIARHFVNAQEQTRALPYLVEAGERAMLAYSIPEAINFFTHALEILQAHPDTALARRAYEGMGNALIFSNDMPGALSSYEAMLRYAEAHGDAAMKVSALNKTGFTYAIRLGQFPEAEKPLAEAEHLARQHGDEMGLAEMFNTRCMMCTAAADFDGVLRHMGESAALARKLGVKKLLANGLDHLSATYTYMTRFEEAWDNAQTGLAIAREIGDREHESSFLIVPIPFYHLSRGDLQAAQQAAEEGTDIAARIGSTMNHGYGAYVCGELARLAGDYEAALRYLDQSVAAAQPLADFLPFALAMPMAALGTVYIEISDVYAERATQLHGRMLELLTLPAGMLAGGSAWTDAGFCAVAVGNLDMASTLFERGLMTPTMHTLLHKPRMLAGAALVALARGQLHEADRLVAEAREYAEMRALKHHAPLVALVEARVKAALGQTDRALEAFERAEAAALAIGVRPVVWQARAGAAQLYASLQQHEQAAQKRRTAQAMIDEIAALFHDDELRRQFVQSAMRHVGAASVG